MTIISVVVLNFIPQCFAEDWPHLLGPQSNGKSTETGLLDRWPLLGVPVVWQKRVGAGYSAPSVRDGKLVLFHRVGDEEVIECFDALTGEPVWKYGYETSYIDPYGYNNGPRCTPVLSEDRCYTFGAEGKIVCLDLATGEPVWMLDSKEEWDVPEAFFGVGSSPVLDDGKLIIMVGGQPNSGLVALDPETGETLWESVGKDTWDGKPKTGWPGEPPVRWADYDKIADYSTPVIAEVNGRRQLFALMRQGLVSLDPETGEVHSDFWFQARVNESVNAINPVVVGNQVFISSSYYRNGSVVLNVNHEDQQFEQAWRSEVLEIHFSTPIVHDGYIYAFSGRNEPDASFRCVEFATGKLMWERDESWRHDTVTPNKFGRGSAIFADGKIIALGEGGLLGLFKPNPERVEEISRWQVPGLQYPSWSAPVLSNQKLYLRSENQLICLDVAE